jgi:hypothetical protein
MLIKIPKKTSHKTKTIGKNEKLDVEKANGKLPAVGSYPPFIDKLSITLKPAHGDHAYQIYKQLWTVIDDNVFQNAGPKSKYSGKYNVVKLISLPWTHHRVIFQVQQEDHQVQHIRLEFNPRKIGSQGLMELHATLMMLLLNGWDYVIEHGRITRIDVGVDIPNVRMDEFLFLPQQGTTTREWGVDGHLESQYSGKSQGNYTAIYSVKKKRIAKGQPWTGKSVVRVERRLRYPSPKKLSDLAKLENPFAKMVLTTVMPQPPDPKKAWEWSMFEDSVNVRGLAKALALVPENRRKQYRDYLKQHPKPWWNPEAIWAQWPEAHGFLSQKFD